jgi:RNA polymerase sigma-70 factor (ECF subfamily)
MPPLPARPDDDPPRPPSFGEAYASEVAFVWRSLRRLGVPERDVEDACQETFLVAHKKYETFVGGSLRAWLFAIAKRVASDHRKKAHVRREVVGAEVPEVVLPETMSQALDAKRARSLLDEILDALDEDKRAVFVLFELEQWPMPEVARVLECALQTAYSRLHAARAIVEARVARAKARESSAT